MPNKKVISGKKEIVDAAFRLVREEGAQALSIRRLAKAMNVSYATFYAYVRNSEEIKKEVVLEGFRILYQKALGAIRQAVEHDNADYRESCAVLAETLYAFAGEYSGVYHIMYAESITLRRDPEAGPFYDYFVHLMRPSGLSAHALHMLDLAVSALISEYLDDSRRVALPPFRVYVDEFVNVAFPPPPSPQM